MLSLNSVLIYSYRLNRVQMWSSNEYSVCTNLLHYSCAKLYSHSYKARQLSSPLWLHKARVDFCHNTLYSIAS